MKTTCSMLNRRAFLRLTLTTGGAAAIMLTGCRPAPSEPQSIGESNEAVDANYYISRKAALLKELNDNFPYFAGVLGKEYDAVAVEAIRREGQQAFEALIPQLPYIGGDMNMLTINLIQSAWCLAMYQALQPRGKTVEDVGRIIYQAVEAMMNAYPRGFSRLGGIIQMSSLSLEDLKISAELSHKRLYEGDWVFDVVEGDGETFDWGIDYSECGICKFFQTQEAPELTPYLCLLDFPMSEATDSGLIRTETLANGNQQCNFRYKWGRPTEPLLPPGFLEES